MSINPFAAYGIEHLSPSSLNQFAQSPASFVLTRLLKKVAATGAPAHRGTAVEAGVSSVLKGSTLTEGVKLAQENFKTLVSLSDDPRIEKEFDAIGGMVEQGVMALKPYGEPTAVQEPVKLVVPELPIPIIGFIDFRFGNVIVDLKSTHALPSKINNTNHERQVALYIAASEGDCKGYLCYVTGKKHGVYEVTDAEQQAKSLARIGVTLGKFLSLSADPMELAQLVIPDVDSFWFSNDAHQRQAAKEVWGI